MTPKPEHRISAVEKRVTSLEGTIEELSSDQAEELKAIRLEIKASYKEIGDFFVKLDESLEAVKATMATKEDLSKIEARIDRIEAAMVTKDDMAAMETRLLDAIKRVFQQKPEGER